MSQPRIQRRYDLDWVRIAALGLLMLHHVGMYYTTWYWHVKSPAASHAIEPLMFLLRPWRISLLFLVSGVASAFLLEKSSRTFLLARSRRLLIPLIFGMLVVIPPQQFYEAVEKIGYQGGYGGFWLSYLTVARHVCPLNDCLDAPTWNHLWFVGYLWVYTVIIWGAWRWGRGALEAVHHGVAQRMTGVGVLLWPFLLLAVARLVMEDRFPPTGFLIDDWYSHACYFSVFALGFLIAREQPAWDALEKSRWVALVVAIATYLFLAWTAVAYGTATSDYDDLASGPLQPLHRVVFALNQWTAIAAILGFTRHFAPGDGPARRYLTDAVFPIYILHQTAIIMIAHYLKPLHWPAPAEGVFIVVATLATCMTGYEVIRRVAWLRPLFGLRDVRSEQPPSPGHLKPRYVNGSVLDQ